MVEDVECFGAELDIRALGWLEASSEFGLAKLYDKHGKTEDALKAIAITCDLAPGSANVRFLYARLLQKTGHAEQAKQEFAEARRALNTERGDTIERAVPGPEVKVGVPEH